MKTLEVHVPEDLAARIEDAAAQRHVSTDDLIRMSVEEKLARDHEFERAAHHVLAKNADLYERLA